jgi:prepilin-type N-terminal cleavage/methylation domain-containing protein
MGAMRSYQGHRDDRGFTLLEVIVAIAILTFGLLAVASMQIGAIQGNSFAGHKTEGTTWAQDKLEELIALSYDDLNHDDSPEQQGGYTVAWTVANGPVANTKLITVSVTYQEKGVARPPIELIGIKPRL